MSKKIASSSFVLKAIAEITEVFKYLIGVRSKADKKTLRSEIEAEKVTLNATITANKKDADTKITSLTGTESAHHKAHVAEEQRLNKNVEDDELTVAQAFEKVRVAVGMNEDGEVSFEGTKYLDDCSTVKEALIALDNAIANI